MRYGASPRYPDPAPLFPASSGRYPNSLVLLIVTAIDCCFRSPCWPIREPRMLRVASTDHCTRVPVAPTGAHQLPASRCSPACRGRTVWRCVSVVMRSSVRTDVCRVAVKSGNEKSRRRCSPDERLMSGLGQRTRQRRGASTREHRDATPRASSVARTTRRCQEVNVADRSSQFIINARMVRPCRSSCWRSASGWSHLRSR